MPPSKRKLRRKTSESHRNIKQECKVRQSESEDGETLEITSHEKSEFPKAEKEMIKKGMTKCSSTALTRKRKIVKAEKLPILPTKVEKMDVCKSYGDKKYVGAHVSVSGGLHNAVVNALEIGAKAFALFLRSQRQWASKPLTEENALKFKQACKDNNFSPNVILPHGSYLLNCGSPKEETLQKSRETLVDELKRCEMLGLAMFNFHPGSTCGEISVDACLDLIAESINLAHQQTKYVITVIENMSCQGNTIGGDFKELRGIIDRVKDKSRVGICLDTCHAFAAGYDLSTEDGYNKMKKDFDSIIGFKYLKGVHLNDSAGKVGCHLDRHENIGKGNIGLQFFRRMMSDSWFNEIPLILETPANVDDADEIKLLYSFC